jgi:feruloyl-CoA synthase
MLKLAPRRVTVRSVGDVRYLESPTPLAAHTATLAETFRDAAARAPDRDFLIERRTAGLRRVTYREALRAAEGVADWLSRDPSDAPVAALSGNSVDHALLMLGCFLARVPFVPVSPAYSLMSQDFAKLRAVIERVKPRAVFVQTKAPFERALAAFEMKAPLITSESIADLYAREPSEAPIVRGDDVAKILFTSGSTGFPKGVPNTHAMLCANQQMITQLWPFLEEDEPPVLVDWLPWSHTFGGNHNFNMVLRHAGTLFVDEGKPSEVLVGASVRNLRDVPPTLYFNVPAGYAAIVPRLEQDDELRRAFFSRLRVMFYAAAALPPDLWTRLVALAKRESEHDVFMTTAWGATETSPLATSAHFAGTPGNIGLPAPGVTLKLVPNGSKLEVRVKGPSVMRGYLDEPELTKNAFDEEGFYRIGDAVRFADEADPTSGLMFDGRVAEDFKLASGTWVSVTAVRTGILAHAGDALSDVIVCGHDREHVAILAWPRRSIDDALVTDVSTALAAWNAANPASSSRVLRVMLLREPPNIDAGEITDKGYTNQRATRERRSADVARLFASEPDAEVIVLAG